MLDTLWKNAKKMNEALPGSFKIEESLELSKGFFGELIAPQRVHYAATTTPVTSLFWHFTERKIQNQMDGTINQLDHYWGTDLDDTPPEISNHPVIAKRFKYTGKVPQTPKELLSSWNDMIQQSIQRTPESMDIVVLWYMPWLLGDTWSPLFTRIGMLLLENPNRTFVDVLPTGT